jgi:hypothetical protein
MPGDSCIVTYDVENFEGFNQLLRRLAREVTAFVIEHVGGRAFSSTLRLTVRPK